MEIDLGFPIETKFSSDKRLVPPEGNINAKVAIVGEAPGADEVKFIRPFVGMAGQLLEQCLHGGGVTRADCYITNVVKVHPDGNDITPYYGKKGFTQEGMKWVKALKDELSLCGANVIVPLGDTALNALTGKSGITKWRGSILASTLLPGRKVIPTIHPGAALRQYLYKFYIINDLKKVREEAFSKEIELPQRTLHIFPKFEEVMSFIKHLREERKRVCTDLEVVNQEVSHIGLANGPKYAMSIDVASNRYSLEEEMQIWLAYAGLMEDPLVPKINQNILFDMLMLCKKNGIIVKGRIDDCMIGHALNYPDFPKGLDFITSIYTREPYYKEEGKQWKYGIWDPTTFARYNAKDCCVVMDAMPQIEAEMDLMGTRTAYEKRVKLLPALLYMEMRGIKADQSALADIKVGITAKIKELEDKLNKMVGFEFNPRSSKQCQQYFYITKGVKPYLDRKTHKPTVDDIAMTRLARRGYREAELIKEIRGLSKLKGTYLDIAFDPDGRLRCSINPSGTTSGRLSTSQTIFGTGTNMQNLPDQFKQFLVADPGMVMVEVDKVQAEWIDVAYRCGDANMIEVVEKKLDAHTRTAQMMYLAPADLIKLENKLIGHTTDESVILAIRKEKCPEVFKYNPPARMSMRQMAKKCNHGRNYKMGDMVFSLTADVDLKESKRAGSLYYNGYPGIQQWWSSVITTLQMNNRTLVNAHGRVRKFMDRWGDELFKQAIAYLPQSDVADLVNNSIEEIYNTQGGVMKHVDMLIQVHDSLLFQYPISRLKDLPTVLRLIFWIMEKTLKVGAREFVIPTDAKIGFNWRDLQEIKFIDDDDEAMYQVIKEVIDSIKPKSANDIIEQAIIDIEASDGEEGVNDSTA